MNHDRAIQAIIVIFLLLLLVLIPARVVVSLAEETYVYKVNLYTYQEGILARYNMLVLAYYPAKGEIRVSGGLIKPNLDERDAIIKVFNMKPIKATGIGSHVYAVEGIGAPYICKNIPLFEIGESDISGVLMLIQRENRPVPIKFDGEVRVRGLKVYINLELTAATEPICGEPLSGSSLKYMVGIPALLLTIAAIYTFAVWRKNLTERWSLVLYGY